jgi:drug/metabolite transporter (DMT)-like permease
MGYLFLMLSIFSGAVNGYCGKKTSGKMNTFRDATLVNTLRMVFAMVVGLAIIAIGGNIDRIMPTPTLIAITAFTGAMLGLYATLWLVVVKTGAYMMMDVFQTAAVLIPIVLSFFFFGDEIYINQWIGFAILLVAAIVMCSYNNSIKQKITVKSLIVLLIASVTCGLQSFGTRMLKHWASDVPTAVYNFYVYIFAALTLLVCFLFISPAKGEKEPQEKFRVSSILGYLIVMSVSLFANSFFGASATRAGLSPMQQYPLNYGGSLIIASLMASLLFREKLTVKCIAGMVLTFIGLIVINLKDILGVA